MKKRDVITAVAASVAVGAVAAPAALAASAGGPATVTVRIEGLDRTLLAPTVVHTASGSITEFGAPAGKCPATSAQGALNDATHGHWKGSWSKQYDEYYVTRILGDLQASAKDYWALYVNGAYASSGACDVSLKSGDTVLFAVVPGKGKAPEALGVSLPAKGTDGQQVTPKVVYYTAKGVAHPLTGATVRFDGKALRTDAGGETAPITLSGRGERTLTVSKSGFLRTEATIEVTA